MKSLAQEKDRYSSVVHLQTTTDLEIKLSQAVPLQDLVGVLTWVWENDSSW